VRLPSGRHHASQIRSAPPAATPEEHAVTVPGPGRQPRQQSRHHFWALRTPDAAAAIYGTITAGAVIAASAGHQPAGAILAVTAATLAVFWLAHVYAHALAHHLRGTTGLNWTAITAAMSEERPMLEAPAAPLLLLLLGTLGLLRERTAVRLALWIGVVQLIAWGVAYARRQQWGWPTALAAGAVNGTLGLIIVALEVFLH
jgi:hypothetical protein